MLAEKSGNLTQLVFSALSRVLIPLFSAIFPRPACLLIRRSNLPFEKAALGSRDGACAPI